MATWRNYLMNKLIDLNYTYREDAEKGIMNAIEMFEDLHPEEADIIERKILGLSGTIPISYKGCSYNIPIMIHLLPGFPYQTPHAFVKPTSTMVIKPNSNVGTDGRVLIPNLKDWVKFFPQTPTLKLLELIKELQKTFEKQPPVFSCGNSSMGRFPVYSYGESYIQRQLLDLGYTHKEDAKRCISAVMNMFVDLQPEVTVGSIEDIDIRILALSGTIPISHKGCSYNIPITIHLLPDFPHEAPHIFVKPTSTMVVSPNNNVGRDGRVCIPELMDWVNHHDHSTKFIEMMEKLQMTFGQHPPVYTPNKLQQGPTTTMVAKPEGRPSDDSKMCIICLEEPYNTVFLPCGHMCLCIQCAASVKEKNHLCPICRGGIQSFQRVFTP